MTTKPDPRNPLQGVTLERMLTELEANLGWEAIGKRIPIRCFTSVPSVPSSLKFLRKTPSVHAKLHVYPLSAPPATAGHGSTIGRYGS